MSQANLDFIQTPSPRIASQIVVIGASHGGIQALMVLIAMLPSDFPAAIVVVQHIAAHRPSLLAHVLSYHTGICVQQVAGGESLQGGQVYVAPPDRHVLVNAGGVLSLSDAPKDTYSRPAINLLFESAATSYGARATAVVLTGANSDGARGVRAIKEGGGYVFAQDKSTADCYFMPRAAIDTGCVDAVLPLPEIASFLVQRHNKIK